MLKTFKILYTFGVLSFCSIGLSTSSGAAPLCLSIQPGVSPECIYYDVSQCIDDANRLGVSCSGNIDYMKTHMSAHFSGSGQFCLTDISTFVSCIYQTQQECLESISPTNLGVCVDKDNAKGTLAFAEGDDINKDRSILSGIDSLGAASSVAPNESSFDLLKPFDLNVNNKGSALDLNE